MKLTRRWISLNFYRTFVNRILIFYKMENGMTDKVMVGYITGMYMCFN